MTWNEEPCETLGAEGFRAEIWSDQDPDNPREWAEHLGTMYCAHRRYTLGDVRVEGQEDLLAELLGVDTDEFPDNPWDEIDKRYIWLPLYLYDHGGITMSTGPFSCPWDSGQVGVIAVSKSKVREEFGWQRLTQDRIHRIEDYLRAEVEEYDSYLTGEVYGYRVLDPQGEECDSCWGFYGRDKVRAEAQESLTRVLEQRRVRDPDGQLLLQFGEGGQE